MSEALCVKMRYTNRRILYFTLIYNLTLFSKCRLNENPSVTFKTLFCILTSKHTKLAHKIGDEKNATAKSDGGNYPCHR